MITKKIVIASLVAIVAASCTAPAKKSDQSKSIFDGKTLKGWTRFGGEASYKVENAAIVGRTTEGSPNTFLCSNKDYANFQLEFDVKCDTGLNSGVQIRSRKKTEADIRPEEKNATNAHVGRVFGPQVEIESSPGQAAYIYGEATGLKWLSAQPQSKDPKVNQHSKFKNDKWNHFKIIAKGPRIQTFINGEKIEDLTHEVIYKTHPTGFIGLQVHGIKAGSGPYKVAWKNIMIRELK